MLRWWSWLYVPLPLEGRVRPKAGGGVLRAARRRKRTSSTSQTTPPGPAVRPPLKGEVGLALIRRVVVIAIELMPVLPLALRPPPTRGEGPAEGRGWGRL
ncbi:MAG: hypothetical protein EOR96_12995 [Mesorhizobium sp.]|nr:MAG: hypothetical protein EOR96_12995 [Mesorhizobium sp.]